MEGTAVFREGTTGNIVLDSVTRRPLRSWMKPTQLAQGTGLHPSKFVLGPLVLSKRPAVFTCSQNFLFVHYCTIFQMHDYSSIYQLWYKKKPLMLRRPRSSWGFDALLKCTSVVVLKVEKALYIHSPHQQSLPARDSNSQPFNYKSNSLTIRPRLPHNDVNLHYFYPTQLTTAFRLYIYCQYVCFVGIEPTTFCAANAMLYHWALPFIPYLHHSSTLNSMSITNLKY